MASISPDYFHLTSTETALALVLPKSLQSDINSLRKIHDKAYKTWEPHINILYPFVDPSRLSAAIETLREYLRSNAPESFKVNLDSVGVFTHRKNATVFLKPSEYSEERLCSLRRGLAKALGCNERDGTYDGTFRPHLSIGQEGFKGPTLDRLVTKVENLVGTEWEGSALAVLKRGNRGEMIEVDNLPLWIPNDKNRENEEYLYPPIGWRGCYYFDAECGWSLYNTKYIPHEGRTDPVDVEVSSYNLMAAPDAPSLTSRLPFIVKAISEGATQMLDSLQVICLQEVDDEILPLLLDESSLQRRYPFSTHHPASVLHSRRNLVTMSSKPFCFDVVEFAERHKASLVVSLLDSPLEVANVHLTSGLTNESVAAKKSQMEILSKHFTHRQIGNNKIAIIAGDFNLTTSSSTIETALSREIITPETATTLSYVINPDIWEDVFTIIKRNQEEVENEEIIEGEEGATFDRLANPLAAVSKAIIDDRPQRYDRILFRKGTRTIPGNFKIFGRPQLDGNCGSDHYGICARLRIEVIEELDVAHTGERLRESEFPGTPCERLKLTDDSKDIGLLLKSYLPTAADRSQREDALAVLYDTLSKDSGLGDVILAPLGSYCMDTYFTDSDVDVLVIGCVLPTVFFNVATKRLKNLGSSKTDSGHDFRGVHLVNSLVSIVEVCITGIKFDLQYCQAPEIVSRYTSAKQTYDLRSLVFDETLISTISPSALLPLNTYRDSAYLLNTIPHLQSYQNAHRFLSQYLKRRGLYSAKFGYLGGIHLSLLLNRVVKLSACNTNPEEGDPSSNLNDTTISSATIIRAFFSYYATFDWANDIVLEPELKKQAKPLRTSRDAVFIHAIHTPTARPNVASSCTRLSSQIITSEFKLATEKLEKGDWEWFLRPQELCIRDFMDDFGAFVRVTVDMWEIDDIGGEKVREIIGALESKLPRLMVGLGRVTELEGRVWPARLRMNNGKKESVDNGLQGYYLVGVSATKGNMNTERKKLLEARVVAAVREFEMTIKNLREFDGGNVWVSMDVVSRKSILKMDLVIDSRDWSDIERREKSEPDAEEVEMIRPVEPNTHAPARHVAPSYLRPAQDIISRIRWDPKLSENDFLIGYEDRFLGVKESELAKWKTEQTDEEFIPMHRIVWVRQKGLREGEKIWDRRNKVDMLFGSGARRDTRNGRQS